MYTTRKNISAKNVKLYFGRLLNKYNVIWPCVATERQNKKYNVVPYESF